MTMRTRHTRTAAATAALAAGVLAAMALQPGAHATQTLAARNPAVEVRTQVIHRTVHVSGGGRHGAAPARVPRVRSGARARARPRRHHPRQRVARRGSAATARFAGGDPAEPRDTRLRVRRPRRRLPWRPEPARDTRVRVRRPRRRPRVHPPQPRACRAPASSGRRSPRTPADRATATIVGSDAAMTDVATLPRLRIDRAAARTG